MCKDYIALTGCCVNLQEHPEIEWYLWIDSDTMIINPTFEMPLKKFKGKDLIIWGNETALLEGDGRNGTATSQQHLSQAPCHNTIASQSQQPLQCIGPHPAAVQWMADSVGSATAQESCCEALKQAAGGVSQLCSVLKNHDFLQA